MNQVSKNLMKILVFPFFGLSLLLMGCSPRTKEVVTVENAPSDLLKKIAQVNSNTNPSEVEDLFYDIVEMTLKDVSSLVTLENIEKDSIVNDTENLKDLSVSSQDYHMYMVYYATNEEFYSLESVDLSTQNSSTLLEASSQGFTSVNILPVNEQEDSFAKDNVSMKVESVQITQNEEEIEDFSLISHALLEYSLYAWLGQQYTIAPLETPSQYTFELTKEGDEYLWTIKLQDKDGYNALYEEAYEQAYGISRKAINEDGSLMADSWETQKICWILTFDEEGRMKSADYQDLTQITYQETTLDLKARDTLQIEEASNEKLSFFKKFFSQIKDKTLKEGDNFVLFEKP